MAQRVYFDRNVFSGEEVTRGETELFGKDDAAILWKFLIGVFQLIGDETEG